MYLIELTPCFPQNTTLAEQEKKIEEEYREVKTAENLDNKLQELLDLAQTIVGYLKLSEGINEYSRAIFHEPKSNLSVLKKLMKNKEYKRVAWLSLNHFYTLIVNNYTSNRVEEIVERYLNKHKEKLQSRQNKWKDIV